MQHGRDMDHLIPQPKPVGRPKGALGTAWRLDLEALCLICDLQIDGMGFKEALKTLRDFAAMPGVSIPSAGSILIDADRTTHAKRLQRWAARYQRKNDLLERVCSSLLSSLGSKPEGCCLLVPALPAAELCDGTEIWGD
jgi:hypothetical protein